VALSPLGRRHALLAFLAYLAFVVYGSLVPFDYRDHSFHQAMDQFRAIAYLNLGVGSRADWIANIVLYVPLAFLGCVWFLGMRRPTALRYLGLVFVFAFCVAVAVAVEFTQIFFAPRTVSLNDLLAETIGTLGGIVLWIVGSRRIVALWDAFAQGGRQSVVAAIATYGVIYIVLSLFPYDFVLSGQELAWKLASGNQAWLITPGCGALLPCSARLAGDAIGIAPLGVFLGLLAPATSYRRVFMVGVLLGLLLELLQLFLASGVSQGLSVLMRGMGLVGGVAVSQLLLHHGPSRLAEIIRRASFFASLPYLALLAGLNGWFSGAWLSPAEALARLADVRFMPFYYHYFSTEPVAMASALANAVMYAPVGLLLWARTAGQVRTVDHPALKAALWAVLLALPVELGKLFVPLKHPDFTDLLIAGSAAALTYAMVRWLELVLVEGAPTQPAPRPKLLTATPVKMPFKWPMPHPANLLIAVPPVLAVGAGLARYPVGSALLVLALLVYAVLLWRWPLLWLIAIPALLPTLDLSPLSGRLLLDEFDLIVLVTLAVCYVRLYRVKPAPWPHQLVKVAVVLLWVTWCMATARGLWPMWGATGGVLASSHSPLEAWQVGKGLLWALLLVPMIRRVPRESLEMAQKYVLNGLIAGLGVVTLVVLWERYVFVGLLDFDNVFRVTGTFSSMNTGGAYIEAFIAFAFPALAVWVVMQRSWALQFLGIAAACLSCYVMLVTFSRGGYAGLAVGLIVVGLGTFRVRSGLPARRWVAVAGLMAVAVAVAVPVISGGFAQYRLARAAEDLSIREGHWRRALDLMDDDVLAAVGGMGFGQYPTLYLLYSGARIPTGTYSVTREGDNPYLRLTAGEAVFLDQLVDVLPETRYRLTARVRQEFGGKGLTVALCEKALLYSFDCVWKSLESDSPETGWSLVSFEVETGTLGRTARWPHRPVKLSLHNPGGGPIDVDDVSLKTPDGRELVANGDFATGAARWLFVTDQDLAWHIHEQWVETYFAQGLLGVSAVVILLAAAAAVLWPAVRGGDPWATALAGALTAFLTVGLLGSVMDTSRLSMLFYLGAFCACLLTGGKPRQLVGMRSRQSSG
jgi:VanZ family protein